MNKNQKQKTWMQYTVTYIKGIYYQTLNSMSNIGKIHAPLSTEENGSVDTSS